jgi:hypothetical protein
VNSVFEVVGDGTVQREGGNGFAALDSEGAAGAKRACGVSVLEASAASHARCRSSTIGMARKSEQALDTIQRKRT